MVYNCYTDSRAIKTLVWLAGALALVACFFCGLNYCMASHYTAEHSIIALAYGNVWLLVCVGAATSTVLSKHLGSKLLLSLRTRRIVRTQLTGKVVTFDVRNSIIVAKHAEFDWVNTEFTLVVPVEDTGVVELAEHVTCMVELRLDRNGRLLGAKLLD